MKVNLLIIGAGRSGTTSIYKYLDQHPDVCFSSIKEIHYFSIEELYKRGEKYYHSFYDHYQGEKLYASADTYLMMDYQAIEKIKAYNENIKILVMLRDPVDRAYSSYNYSVNYGYHDALENFSDCISFEKDIEKVNDLIQRNNLGHLYASQYYKHLSRWLKVFPKENFVFLTTKELKEDPEGLYRKLCLDLNIAEFSLENSGKAHNANAVPKNKGLEQFLLNRNNPIRSLLRNMLPSFIKTSILKSTFVDKLHGLNRKEQAYEKLSDEEYKKMKDYFGSDLQSLNDELKINLS